MDAIAGRLEEGAQKGKGRALAVGAGDMDDRRQMLVRTAECREQPLYPLERQIDEPDMERLQPLENDIAGQRPNSMPAAPKDGGTGAPCRVRRSRSRASVALSSRRGTTMSTMPCSSRYSAR